MGTMEPNESFELLRQLGAGGFAHTYQARVLDSDLREEFETDEVVLKIPLSKDKERALKNELELNAVLHQRVKDLQSSNIARYLGFAVYDRRIVMVMEYVPDGSLRDRIGKIGSQKPLPAAHAIRIIRGVLNGLAAIHREHIFHRDLKPENILMDGDTPKISDLGISRLLASNDLASTTTGTIFYMSPEILGPEGASFPSDIWSVGVTLYEMVTGRLPFGDKTTPIRSMVELICREAHASACKVNPEIPRRLSRILDRALAKDARERYATAAEMADALDRCAQGEDVESDRAITVLLDGLRTEASAARMEERLRQLVAQHPRDARVQQALGVFYNRSLRFAEAVAAFRKGLQFSPDHALLHWDLAMAYQGLGKHAEASQSLERAIALGLDPSMQRHATALLKSLQRGGR